MDLGRILTRAWQIIWQHKVLWIFGILASCAGGGGGGGGGFGGSSNVSEPQNFGPQFEQFGRNLENFLESGGWVLIAGIFCLLLLIGILAWVVGIFGKVGLIRGVLRAEDGQPINFRALSGDARAQLGSALGLNLVLGLIAFLGAVGLLLLGIPLGVLTLGFGLICLVCLVVPLAIVFSIYSEVANVALVKERLSINEALGKSWSLLRSQPGPLAGLAIALFIIGVLASLVMLLPLVVVFAPILFTIFTDPDAMSRGFLIAGVLFLLVLPILLLLQGILVSYIQSVWTLGYLQLDAASGTPEVIVKPRRPRTPRTSKA
ncbi:MAG: hypothetical protein KIS85_03770 [Anaerolineales bacterium]|nr:hypothetical protein [Anaerolineales bacterium]